MTAVALTVAGSDPSGGAGLQADLKTFHQHGVYGMSVVTLLTVQNTQAVQDVMPLDPSFVIAQLVAVLSDIPPGAAKTGALGSAAIVEVLAEAASSFAFPLVVDPVMISKHGNPLIDGDAVAVVRDRLLPRAFLITPNVHEAGALAGIDVDDRASMEEAARRIAGLGARNVLIKGGARFVRAIDVLLLDGDVHELAADRIETTRTHGTGCAFSAAITARLARGESLGNAVSGAKRFITDAIRTAPSLGDGVGPINMQVEISP
jgi:hydroxymethylpyrimidine/phosphomethylpyrimidine kinase